MKRLKEIIFYLGFNPGILIITLKNWTWFRKDYRLFKSLNNHSKFPLGKLYPVLSEKGTCAGTASGYYFHQDLFVAQKIFLANPEKHVDIGSRIDGFVAHVASYRTLEVLDIRPLNNTTTNITFRQADITNPDPAYHSYTDSLSCLHVIEHFGLGRYNDRIDPDGHIKGLEFIRKILKPKGKLYLSTPIGPQRVEFNAHRVFSMSYLLGLIEPEYHIDSFSYVDDSGQLHSHAELLPEYIDNNYGCSYGCAIFELTKRT